MHKTIWMKNAKMTKVEEDSDESLTQRLGKMQREKLHTLSPDEAGTRLDLSDIHGGTLKPTDLSSEMKTSFLEYLCPLLLLVLPNVRDGLNLFTAVFCTQ